MDERNEAGLSTISRDEKGFMSLALVTGVFNKLKKLDQCL